MLEVAGLSCHYGPIQALWDITLDVDEGELVSYKSRTLAEMLEKQPEEVIRKAVRGMLPRNKLRKHWMRRLRLMPIL